MPKVYRPHSPGDSRFTDTRAALHASSSASKDQSRLTTLGAVSRLLPGDGCAAFIEVLLRGIATHRQTGSSGVNGRNRGAAHFLETHF